MTQTSSTVVNGGSTVLDNHGSARKAPATWRRIDATTIAAERPGHMVVRRVRVPILDPALLFDVAIEDGVIGRIDPVEGHEGDDALELWPGYVECHAHLALPANFDDSLDDPRVIALQYLFHGVTRVIDMFGFPLVKKLWESGKAESALPYPELVHCGYAVTSMCDSSGRTGHGVEFPAPVYMLGVQGDLEVVLRANLERGASFLKVMFTDGTEQPDNAARFSRLPTRILDYVARVTAEHGIPVVLDCNTRSEVLQAYSHGFRLFAHPVRDSVLSPADWEALSGARFVSTLSGLRPLIMRREDFLDEYSRPGFRETQDLTNLEFAAKMEEPFGVQFNRQETRLAALDDMRRNCLSALDRDALLVGTDCGNLGTFHGYSLLREIDLLAAGDNDVPAQRRRLRYAATVAGSQLFNHLAGRADTGPPIAVGRAATFNLLRPVGMGQTLSTLPEVTVADGTMVDRRAIVRSIQALRSSASSSKVVL
jgi:hypothetical protein